MKFEGVIYPNGLDIRRGPSQGYFITARRDIPAGSNVIKASAAVMLPTSPSVHSHLRGAVACRP